MTEADNSIMVAALDFGTTYSGYAFSMRHEFKTDPLKIHANQAWNAGARALLSLKTPTCLLLNGQKELIAFGYDAENKYSDLVMDGEHHDYFYFHRFKMNLHNNKNIKSEMVLEDITGKPVPAIDIFSLSIHALVKHLMGLLHTQGTGLDIHEIRWVLTVPAIWSDAAKSFMRKSAEKAGIPQDKLIIALEPEAASIYCQYLPVEKLRGAEAGFTVTKPGTTYMVVDLGGGTADITVHEKGLNGQLKEMYQASGNECGGTSVDKRFYELFIKILGEPIMTKLTKEDPTAHLDLFREFETVKRTISPSKTGKINITIPYASLDAICKKYLHKDLSTAVASSVYAKQIVLRGDKMRIDVDIMKDIFKPTIENIISLMEDIFETAESDVSQILLVGGFSECSLIQDTVKNSFSDKRVIVPEEAGLSVLKGAVLFGHKPDYIQSRVMRFTYGVETSEPFDPDEHDEEYIFEADGKEMCGELFDVIVEKNQNVEIGSVFESQHSTVYKMQDAMTLELYTTTEDDPEYTDEEGCSYLGSATIVFPEPFEEERCVHVKFIFGNTELGLEAEDEISGESIQASFNLI